MKSQHLLISTSQAFWLVPWVPPGHHICYICLLLLTINEDKGQKQEWTSLLTLSFHNPKNNIKTEATLVAFIRVLV